MPNRRLFLACLVFSGVALANIGAYAALRIGFTSEAFASAQKAGKPILVDITAPWCPTCKAQQPILRQQMKDARRSELVIFEVDFDSQKEAVRSFNARSQSTLIVFKGETEIGRSVGDTNPASIAALLDAAL
jgi:thioredoxin 1